MWTGTGIPFFCGDFRYWDNFYLCDDLNDSRKYSINVQCWNNKICKKIKNSAQGKYLIIGKYRNRRIVADNIFAISDETKIIVPKKKPLKKEAQKKEVPSLYDVCMNYIYNPMYLIPENIKFEQKSGVLPNGNSLFWVLEKISEEEYIFCLNPNLIPYVQETKFNCFLVKTKNKYFNVGEGLKKGFYKSKGKRKILNSEMPLFEEISFLN